MNPLARYDAAEKRIAAGETSLQLRNEAVLALARGGATDLALRRFEELGLASAIDNEDSQALLGRLLKDQAMALSGEARGSKLIESAQAYNRAFDLTRGTYSGINAATLYTLAGQDKLGLQLAARTEELVNETDLPKHEEGRYYLKATRAEILLLRGDKDGAGTALSDAIAEDPKNVLARTSTLRQFERILTHRKHALDWLDPYRLPSVCFFAGSMPDPGTEMSSCAPLRARMTDLIQRLNIGEGFGALAAGRDIQFAEALLETGADLHVVLPIPVNAFLEKSVLAFGEDWKERFDACLAAASSLQIATQDQSLAGQLSIRYAANLAMGTVIRVAETRLSHPVQVLLAPKSGSVSEALGQSWKEAGQDVTITIGAETRTSKSKTQDKRQTDRVLSAMLFADLFKFSDLDHAQTLKTVESVLAPLAEILQSFSNRLHHLNSWGDGIFAAFEKVEDAADAALAMQSRMQQLDLAALGLPSHLSLRIGAHYGPVSVGADPLTGRTTLYGSQVAQAAKIEPLAVPGSILVSEAFASALALSGRRDRATSYIGKHQLNALEKEVRLFALVPSATVH